MDPIKMMGENDMNKILTEIFEKFDRNGNGTMELREFKQAWRDLKLSGSDQEIVRAFHKVDTDRSGVIELPEFKTAIKGERFAELNMQTLVDNMEGTLSSLDTYLKNFKEKYQKAVATARRRKKNRGKMIQTIANRAVEILGKLNEVNAEENVEKDEEGARFYRQLCETYDAYDKDGNGELEFAEYLKAWRFLEQPGTD
eukprot:UN31594